MIITIDTNIGHQLLPVLPSAQAFLANVGYMHKTKLSTWGGTSLLALSMLLLPVATTMAQTTTPPPEPRPPETRFVGSCTPTLRLIPLPPKPGTMPPSQDMLEGA